MMISIPTSNPTSVEWRGVARRFTFLALPGTVPDGGMSPFDSQVASDRRNLALRSVVHAAAAGRAAKGFIALYGAPEWVALALAHCPPNFELRAWVAVACRSKGASWIARSHKALAMVAPRGVSVSFAPLRVPHRRCAACGESLHDWGGRRHRMHEEGTRLTDVWTDLDLELEDAAPHRLVERITELTGARGGSPVVVAPDLFRSEPAGGPLPPDGAVPAALRPMLNQAVRGDCLEVLRRIPSECVDLAFADPPYNLEKAYASYIDKRARTEYITWCNSWLMEYARVVRPGGTIAVLTLPHWAVEHAQFLMRHRGLRFDRWIVWDALAEPKGNGLLPAHYTLLMFTKGFKRKASLLPPYSASDELCRRRACVAKRAPAARAQLADIWSDIPRVRHARNREDGHPCQLPLALMQRVIAIAAPPGGIVLDTFCGTGTTGAAARTLARRAILADSDQEYVEIARRKLAGRGSKAEAPPAG